MFFHCIFVLQGPEPTPTQTSTSEHPTTHTCEDGWTQCEVKIGEILKKNWENLFEEKSYKTTFSVEHDVSLCESAPLCQTVELMNKV